MNNPAEKRPITWKWELVFLAVILLWGIALRSLWWERVAVEHFDEGVYASSFWFGVDYNFHYPGLQYFAPPLLPTSIEWSVIFLGNHDWVPMLPGMASGCLTILAMWWLVRCWSGGCGGLAGALLVASSDYHILFSRTALTEPLLGFLLVLSVGLIWRSLKNIPTGNPEPTDFRWALLAGFATGLCWLTKYNGWLPLAIGWFGMGFWLIMTRGTRTQWAQSAKRLTVVSVTSGFLFGLYVYALQDEGGYQVVADNHRQYLVGFAGWWDSAQKQLWTLYQIKSGFDYVPFLLLFSWLFWNPHQPRRVHLVVVWLFAFANFGSSVVAIFSGWCFAVFQCYQQLSRKSSDELSQFPLGVSFALTWLTGMLVAIPFYHPYPRLTMPLVLAGYAALGLLFQSLWETNEETPDEHVTQEKPVSRRFRLSAIVVIWVVCGGYYFSLDYETTAWQARSELRRATVQLIESAERKTQALGHEPDEFIVYTGEPAALHHVARRDLLVIPIMDISFAERPSEIPPVPIYFLEGPYITNNESHIAIWQKLGGRFELVDQASYVPSDLVLLNDLAPWELKKDRSEHAKELKLYRLR